MKSKKKKKQTLFQNYTSLLMCTEQFTSSMQLPATKNVMCLLGPDLVNVLIQTPWGA